MKITGAEAVIKALERWGVQRVYGIPGIQNLELFDALRDAPFKVTLVTHELCASFMADATSRCTGRVGVCVFVPGPGLTNAFTGIAEALLDSSPMLIIVPDVRDDVDVRFQLHQIDQVGAVRPIVKKVFKLEDPGQIPTVFDEAFVTALTGEPGPVVVDIPYNYFSQTADFTFKPKPQIEHSIGAETRERISEVATLIDRSRQIGLYVGFGASDATAELVTLAERLQAPVATTISGRGAIPEDHPLSVGYGFGPSGNPWAEEAFSNIDLVIAIACKFGEVATGAYGLKRPKRLVHVDASPSVLNKNMPADIALVCDAKTFLRELTSRLPARPTNQALLDRIATAKRAYFEALENSPPSKEYVNPARLLYKLRLKLERDAIITTDSGGHTFWPIPNFAVYEPRTCLSPMDYQAMGFSVPAAVSAKLAWPQRQVVGLVGDGGFLMTGFELITAVREGAHLIILIFNDGALGIIKEQQKAIYGRSSCVNLYNPDFQLLAEALGAYYVSINNDFEIEKGIEHALVATKPCVLEAKIRYAEVHPFFKAVAWTHFKRMPLSMKLHLVGRLAWRYITGMD